VSSPSQVIVLVEDQRHQMLIRRYLLGKGLSRHQVRFNPPYRWEGSGEQRVRQSYSGEVKALRKRQAKKTQTALIVVIDADTGTVEDRLRQLADALAAQQVPAIDPSAEQIARLVPKRNVETWILCLNQEPVDEESDYKGTRNDWNHLIPPAAENLVAWARPNVELPAHVVQSLRQGIEELLHLRLRPV
jgi:hypothetical protein